jgi:hypothetical protein
MKLSTLQKLGGISLILGVAFLSMWAICWTTLLPVQERARDASILILNSNWVWIAALAFPGIVLMIFGFTAVYSKIYNNSGVWGLVGYLLIVLAYLFQAAKVTWEIFVYPAIVSHGPSIALFRDKILFLHPQVRLFRTLAETTIFLGVVIFCTVLIRSRAFPKSGGILILCGALIYAIGPMLNIYIGIAGVLILSAGCFILGTRLLCEPKK